VIANIDRAGGHIVVLGALVLVGIVAALIYWLVRRAGSRRSGRASPGREAGGSGPGG